MITCTSFLGPGTDWKFWIYVNYNTRTDFIIQVTTSLSVAKYKNCTIKISDSKVVHSLCCELHCTVNLDSV